MGKTHKQSIFDDKFLFQKAYKKLKSDAYYDKTKVILKKDIVEFENENEEKLDMQLSNIQNQLINADNDAWEKYVNEKILNDIDCIILPKKIKKNSEENSDIISNVESESKNINISEYQSFMQLPVIGHILSVIWVLTIGATIDEGVIHCYGNRLREELHSSHDYYKYKSKITFSPYLFKPYYLQYENWQDSALKIAEQHIKNHDDILIFTLDFHRFYYGLDIDSQFKKYVLEESGLSEDNKDDTDEQKTLKRLNNLMFKIIEKYAQVYKKYFPDSKDESTGNILPIGFLPSNILANLALKKFDKIIVDNWSPLYYGRYVDDVIIVDKISHTHPLYEQIRGKSISTEDFIAKYFKSCCRLGILKKHSQHPYQLNSQLLNILGNKTKLFFNIEKCKIFYFSPKNSSELLVTFRKHLEENKSEFRFLPEDEATFQESDYTEIFDIEQHEINKFRDISEIQLNKYKLSKFLAKKQQMLSTGLYENCYFLNRLIETLTDSQLIDNYTLWERIITILSLQKNKGLLIKILLKIEYAINKIRYASHTDQSDSPITDNMCGRLRQILFFDLCRVQSVLRLWSNSNEKDFKRYQQYSRLKKNFTRYDKLIDNYEKARMGDKYLYTIWAEVFLICQEKFRQDKRNAGKTAEEIYLRNDLQSIFQLLASSNLGWDDIKKKTTYKYYPYLVQNYDIFMAYQCVSMVSQMSIDKNSYNNLFQVFIKVNFNPYKKGVDGSGADYGFAISPILEDKEGQKNEDHKQENHKWGIWVNNEAKKSIRIAVSNIEMSYSDAENNLLQLSTKTKERGKKIVRLVNSALKDHADLLVMPECCLPFEWLDMLIHTCKKNDLAVITGIEHVFAGKKAYNLVAVILPFTHHDIPCALVVFHPKNHFSPKEFQCLSERDFELMDAEHLFNNGQTQYELYRWHDFYFSVYCCFELSSITERSLFQSYADAVIAVEWNHDIYYYRNILESLARDLHCYCIQANSSDCGDSRITQPSKHDDQDILRVKGGDAPTILVGTIDIERLRRFQCKGYGEQKADGYFKPTPPLFNKKVVEKKIRGEKLF